MNELPTLVKDHGLEHFAIGPLATRESFVRELKERVTAELVSDFGKERGRVLSGPLGEQIAFAAESLNLTSYVTPEQVAEGICTWLDQTFLNQPLQGFGPRDGNEDNPSPPPSSEGDGGSRAVAFIRTCPFCGQDIPTEEAS